MALVRRLVLGLVAGLVWAVPLGAQEATGAITGKVVDASTQQPLANVEVALAATPHRELSRGDGSFALNGVPAGTYRLRASRIGYGSPAHAHPAAAADRAPGGLPPARPAPARCRGRPGAAAAHPAESGPPVGYPVAPRAERRVAARDKRQPRRERRHPGRNEEGVG